MSMPVHMSIDMLTHVYMHRAIHRMNLADSGALVPCERAVLHGS